MKVLIPVVIGLLIIGCGGGQTLNEKIGLRWEEAESPTLKTHREFIEFQNSYNSNDEGKFILYSQIQEGDELIINEGKYVLNEDIITFSPDNPAIKFPNQPYRVHFTDKHMHLVSTKDGSSSIYFESDYYVVFNADRIPKLEAAKVELEKVTEEIRGIENSMSIGNQFTDEYEKKEKTLGNLGLKKYEIDQDIERFASEMNPPPPGPPPKEFKEKLQSFVNGAITLLLILAVLAGIGCGFALFNSLC